VVVVIFISLVIVALYFKYQFNQSINKVQDISNQHQLEIFQMKYKTASQMRSNITFLNELWLGISIDKVEDLALKNELLNARKFFRYQLLFGFLGFLSIVINGFATA